MREINGVSTTAIITIKIVLYPWGFIYIFCNYSFEKICVFLSEFFRKCASNIEKDEKITQNNNEIK